MPEVANSLLKKELIQVGKLLYQKDFVVASEGNISLKLEKNRILVTPSGVNKGFLTEKELVIVDSGGEKLSGFLNPSSELKMHLVVYQKRNDIRAVVHAHPPYATALTVVGQALENYFLPEAVLTVGKVPLSDYATPTTRAVPRVIEDLIGRHDAILIKNHGVITCGKDLWEAYFRMELVEKLARIYVIAKSLGQIDYLNLEQIRQLEKVRTNLSTK